MSFLDLYPQESVPESNLDLKESRGDILNRALTQKRFDIIIVGGGIQGAVFARLAAFNGLSTILLEALDYGSGTSGKTSKMAHGGLRYLEHFDLRQVFEGVKARQDLLTTAPHLVHSQQFLMPVRNLFQRAKLAIGLTLYDWFVKDKALHHKWVRKADADTSYAGSARGFYMFYDGLMHDTRLVFENIYAARQEGAVCLNHARVDSMVQRAAHVEVGWTDCLTNKKHVLEAGIVVNAAGAWAPLVGRVVPDKAMPQVKYSQGIHLLFKVAWEKPAVLVPLKEKGRNYFVWPHPAGTLVGTTEREVEKPSSYPVPTKGEVEELLAHINRHFPSAGLNRDSLMFAFAGIRTLVLTDSKVKRTSQISRRHIWRYGQGQLMLLGGKFTTAAWTAVEGLEQLLKLAGLKSEIVSLTGRKLPGAYNLEFEREAFRKHCNYRWVPLEVYESCVRRLGARVKRLSLIDTDLALIANKILWADVLHALYYEQAETLEDLVRRLDLELLPDQGVPILEELCEALVGEIPEVAWKEQAVKYVERMSQLQEVLR